MPPNERTIRDCNTTHKKTQHQSKNFSKLVNHTVAGKAIGFALPVRYIAAK
ncbi:MAG: hypothetical protein LBJ00_06430 [Planctomycetaceae bacterium]|nr:hypothetical protein [Planctomycetaceae bacterium]